MKIEIYAAPAVKGLIRYAWIGLGVSGHGVGTAIRRKEIVTLIATLDDKI